MHIMYQMTDLMVVLELYTEHFLDCSGSQVSGKSSQRAYDFKAPPPQILSRGGTIYNLKHSGIIGLFPFPFLIHFTPSLIYLPNREHSFSLARLS